jgi:hypothetical protein
MCSYNAVNGRPSCANGWLLNEVLRERWNFSGAHVTSDCGAVFNLLGPPARAPDPAAAAAWALNNGTDLEMGSTVWAGHLVEAVRRNLTTEAAVDAAVRRGYRPHFVAGRFDGWDSDGKDGGRSDSGESSDSNWSELGIDDIRSPYHERIRLEAALQGLVLLKNTPASGPADGRDRSDDDGTVEAKSRRRGNLLPLEAGAGTVAVLGPLGHTRSGLMSDYESDQTCYGGGHRCVPTLAESIRAVHGELGTTGAPGVGVDSNATDGMALALGLARAADVVVLCLGITKDQEREGVDRADTALPGLQNRFARLVFATGTPVVLVLVHGGQVAIDGLVDPPAAIVEAFNPNDIGGTALARTLFGLENRWGKLPYTIYPYSAMQAFDMVPRPNAVWPGEPVGEAPLHDLPLQRDAGLRHGRSQHDQAPRSDVPVLYGGARVPLRLRALLHDVSGPVVPLENGEPAGEAGGHSNGPGGGRGLPRAQRGRRRGGRGLAAVPLRSRRRHPGPGGPPRADPAPREL